MIKRLLSCVFLGLSLCNFVLAQGDCLSEQAFAEYDGPCFEYSSNELCVTLDITEAIDPEGLEGKYTWDLGDGNMLEGIKVEHCYENPGTYEGELIARFAVDDTFLEDRVKVKIDIETLIKIDETVPEPAQVYFDASQSFIANDSESHGYFWDFGDGQYGCQSLAFHKYKDKGDYWVRLLIKLTSVDQGEYHACGKKLITVE